MSNVLSFRNNDSILPMIFSVWGQQLLEFFFFFLFYVSYNYASALMVLKTKKLSRCLGCTVHHTLHNTIHCFSMSASCHIELASTRIMYFMDNMLTLRFHTTMLSHITHNHKGLKQQTTFHKLTSFLSKIILLMS